MNLFKEEFSQLLKRYSLMNSTTNNKTPDKSLTYQQLVEAIHEVLRENLNINLRIEEQGMKTPVHEIVVATPDAPDVLRIDYNQINSLQARYENFNITEEDDMKLPDKSLYNEINKIEEKVEVFDNEIPLDNSFTINNKELKNNINPSNSTVQKELKEMGNINEKFKKDITKTDSVPNIAMYNMIDEVHKNALVVTNKLEEIRELLMPEPRAIRRLSAILNLPHKKSIQSSSSQQSQSSNTLTNSTLHASHRMTMQRNKAAARRSLQIQQMNSGTDELPVTPTSSRPSLVPSATKKPPATAAKISMSKITVRHSIGTPAINDQQKSVGKMNQNSKYAHIQSTIPKPKKKS